VGVIFGEIHETLGDAEEVPDNTFSGEA